MATNIGESFYSNVQTVYTSCLSTEKKQLILERIVDQVKFLCDETEVPELTSHERNDLHDVRKKTIDLIHKLNRKET